MLKDILKSEKRQFLLVFFIIIILRFFPFWFLNKTLVFGDNYSLLMPGKIFTANWLKQGILPLWNPEVFSGMPWIADISQSVIYPSTLFFIIFKPALALNLTIAAHLFIAYLGMYLLAKKWQLKHPYTLIAAVLWMLSTQVTGSINNLSTLQSIVWLPLLGYWGLNLVKKRQARWWFATIVLCQFLGGYPQHVLYGIGLGVLLSIWRDLVEKKISLAKWLLAWLETAGWTIGLAAIAWLPFLDMLNQSTRLQQSAEQALVGSLNPVMLIKLAIPYFWDNPSAGMKWGPAWNGQPNVAFYLTWLGLLALVGRLIPVVRQILRRNRKKANFKQDAFFLIVIIATLTFSLGEYLPGFALIQKVVPLFRIARYPSMMMIVTNVILILWVGKALEQWLLTTKQFKKISMVLVSVIFFSLGWLLIHTFWFDKLWSIFDSFANYSLTNSPFHTLARDKIILFEILKSTLSIASISLGILLVFYQFKTQKNSEYKKGKLALLLILGIALETGFATHGQFFFAPQNIYQNGDQSQLKMIEDLKTNNEFEQYRLLTRNSNKPYTDYGSYWEALVVRSPFSDSFVDEQDLKTYDHVQALRNGLTPNWNMAYGIPVVNGYTTLLPRDYAEIWHTGQTTRINFVDYIDLLSEKLGLWSVKYYLVDNWFEVAEDLDQFRLLATEGRWQLYERNSVARFHTEKLNEGFKLISQTPNRLVLEFNNGDNDQELIISDRWDKDWQVSVNSQKRTIKNWNGMRSISLDEGFNEIELVYVPKWFYIGLAVTLFVCLTILLIAVRI